MLLEELLDNHFLMREQWPDIMDCSTIGQDNSMFSLIFPDILTNRSSTQPNQLGHIGLGSVHLSDDMRHVTIGQHDIVGPLWLNSRLLAVSYHLRGSRRGSQEQLSSVQVSCRDRVFHKYGQQNRVSLPFRDSKGNGNTAGRSGSDHRSAYAAPCRRQQTNTALHGDV